MSLMKPQSKTKRVSAQANPVKILTHLNLIRENGFANAAILLFGKQPQRFLISSEVRCVQFHGNEIVKPIPAYQVYKGDVFQLVNQTIDFILSRINASVGTRSKDVQVPLQYEIPRAAISEAIVNAIAHRDYTSNGSVQVMLFRNRLEIWNPGQLPHNLTLSKLKQPQGSFPANPLIAEPLYLTGYIERLGTGIPDMIALCKAAGLKEPEFMQEDVFKTVIWRKATGQDTAEAPQEYRRSTVEVERVVLVLEGEMKRLEIQNLLELKHEGNFRDNYLLPALESGFIEMTMPDKPNSPKQKYRLSEKGLSLQKKLIQIKKKK